MSATGTSIVGSLAIRAGSAMPIVCERPLIAAPMMRRLIAGRPVSELPGVIASLFTLCAGAQRSTSRLALRAAVEGRDAQPSDDQRLALALLTAREHLQWLGLQLPFLAPSADAADPRWLRDAPVMRLSFHGDLPPADALRHAAGALPAWLARNLLGMPCGQWLDGWRAGADGWLTSWCIAHPSPPTRWLSSVRAAARAMAMPCRPLDVLGDARGDALSNAPRDALGDALGDGLSNVLSDAHGDVPAGMRTLAHAIARDDAFVARPTWRGAAAESAAWTRQGASTPVHTLWDRLGARIADLARIAGGAPLSCGAIALADGEAIGWSEMSRGLLVHWLRLEPGARDPDRSRAAEYRVLAPTEWNFHPEGALARALAGASAHDARLAAAVFDPCLAFSIDAEAAHA